MSSSKRLFATAIPAALVAFALGAPAVAAPAPAAPAAAAAAPAPAAAAPAAAAPAAPAPLPPASSPDWVQIPAENMLVIDTTKGRVVVEMRPELAPEHVERVKTLARQGFYDGLQFFRVIDQFMAQTGDKANTGAGESPMPELKGTFTFRRGPEVAYVPVGTTPTGGYGFIGSMPVHSQPEALALMTVDGKLRSWGTFCTGVAGMARTQNPDSASSQFFLMRGYANFLDEQYTPWGRVVLGQNVVDSLKAGEPPTDPDLMQKVRVAADMPAAERPNLWRLNPASAAFKARVEAARAAKGAAFTVCDVETPVQSR